MLPVLVLFSQLVVANVVKDVMLGPYAWVVPAELDGNAQTQEWVTWDTDGPYRNWFRAIGRVPGGLCVGPRFYPWPDVTGTWYTAWPQRVGATDRLVVQSDRHYLEIAVEPCTAVTWALP